MTRLRQLGGREVLRALGSFEFRVIKIRGSHAKLGRTPAHGERQTLTVPLHKKLPAGTLHAIYRQALRYLPEQDLKPWFFSDDK
jgi:predicted RNA binding protein YcfA (HicA-like mRNA interferase family)